MTPEKLQTLCEVMQTFGAKPSTVELVKAREEAGEMVTIGRACLVLGVSRCTILRRIRERAIKHEIRPGRNGSLVDLQGLMANR